MTGYTKLFSEIVTSTIWQESTETKVVWVTMLATADRKGQVRASIPGLAKLAGVTIQQCEEAIQCFLSPDPYSRSKENDGRRIEEIDGGWALLNHAKYRARMSKDDKREYQREWIAEKRRKEKKKDESTQVDSDRQSTMSIQAEAEAEANAEAEEQNQNQKSSSFESDSYELPQKEEERIESIPESPSLASGSTESGERMSDNVTTPEKEEEPLELNTGQKSLMTEEAFLAIAEQLEIDKRFASALYIDLDSKGWVDEKGERIKSPSLLLQAVWENSKQNRRRGHREPWQIEADITRCKKQIAEIENDPQSRNRAHGHTLTHDEYVSKWEDDWLAQVAKCREEIQRDYPEDWIRFQSTLKRFPQDPNFPGTSDEWELVVLAQEDEEVPDFEKWSRTFNKENPFMEPDELTSNAKIEIREIKRVIETLKKELKKAL